MNAVVDTNVIVYLILKTPNFWPDSRRLFSQLGEAWAPASWEAEFVNVLSVALRHEDLSPDAASEAITNVSALGIRSVPVHALWTGALTRAHESGLAAYDALFVELAAVRRIPLVTFDKAILNAFPEIAVRPSALLRNLSG